MNTKLTETEITGRLQNIPAWNIVDGVLTRTFHFPDFVGSIRFVNAVADAAEAANHHPDIDIRYNVVRLQLSTHDAGGLTENDFALAQTIDVLS